MLEKAVVICLDAKLLYEEFESIRFYCDRNASSEMYEKVLDEFKLLGKGEYGGGVMIGKILYQKKGNI